MIYTDEGKTTSFTPDQRVEVNKVLSILLRQIEVTLKSESERIQLMDRRPKQTYSKEKPDVFFSYVKQGMLEDLIVELQARV